MTVFNNFSEAYDLMFPWEGRMAAESEFFEALFSRYRVRRVLDCACGTGMHPVLFARMGHESYGSDLSPRMIETAMENAMQSGVTINLRVSSFTELTDNFKPDERFDAVVNLGNSLTLAPTDQDVEKAVRQMFEVLNPGGICVINIFNWDKLAREKLRIMPASIAQSEGRDLTFLRVFHHLGDIIQLNIVVVTREGDAVDTQILRAEQRPIGHATILGYLKKAGFRNWFSYNGYSLGPFDPLNSDALLLIAEKP
ncbi:MAG: class I SAM-dependent methyltransferase [Geobacter sp.]|nr:class I SAM-dependent methyltransferase [Geobacter sp.]